MRTIAILLLILGFCLKAGAQTEHEVLVDIQRSNDALLAHPDGTAVDDFARQVTRLEGRSDYSQESIQYLIGLLRHSDSSDRNIEKSSDFSQTTIEKIWDQATIATKFLIHSLMIQDLIDILKTKSYKRVNQTIEILVNRVFEPGDLEVADALATAVALVPFPEKENLMKVIRERSARFLGEQPIGNLIAERHPVLAMLLNRFNNVSTIMYLSNRLKDGHLPGDLKDQFEQLRIYSVLRESLSNPDDHSLRIAALKFAGDLAESGITGIIDPVILELCQWEDRDPVETRLQARVVKTVTTKKLPLADHYATALNSNISVMRELIVEFKRPESKPGAYYEAQIWNLLHFHTTELSYVEVLLELLEACSHKGMSLERHSDRIQDYWAVARHHNRMDLDHRFTVLTFSFHTNPACFSSMVH